MAAAKVSRKPVQRTMQLVLNAAVTGSSWWRVPGTRAPCGAVAPGTTGPSSLAHS